MEDTKKVSKVHNGKENTKRLSSKILLVELNTVKLYFF